MRIAALCTAVTKMHEVHLVVVPVSGVVGSRLADLPEVVTARSVPLTYRPSAETLKALVGDRRWRERLVDLGPPVGVVPPASPALARRLAEELSVPHAAGVLACRLVMAPLALALSEQLGVPFLIDADDADAAYFGERRDTAPAEYWDRVGRMCLPRAALVLAASNETGRWLSQRYDIARVTAVMPNAVTVPPWSGLGRPPGRGRLLFVGNLGYAPNVEGLSWFIESVLPRLAPEVTLDVVGSGGDVRALSHPRVTFHGWVHDLGPHYEAADAVVAPIFSGSGTRIKVLEAFAHGRPVVATAKAVEGIGASDRTHLRVVDDAQAFASACRLVLDGGVGEPMAERAYQLVRTEHDLSTVARRASLLISSAMNDAASPPPAREGGR
jgi:glycosyltransferase involved in cell wall biosynthesis